MRGGDRGVRKPVLGSREASGGSAAGLRGEHQVPDVDHQPHALPEDERGVELVDRVAKEGETSEKADPPEGKRHHGLSLLLRRRPLHQEPGREDELTPKPNGHPERFGAVETHVSGLSMNVKPCGGKGCMDIETRVRLLGNFITDVATEKPGNADKVDKNSQRTVPYVVMGGTIGSRPMADGNLNERASFAKQQRAKKAVTALKGGKA